MSLDATRNEPVGSAAERAARDRLLGILLISVAFFLFACLDATAKYLGDELPALQIVWCRFFTHLVLALVLFRIWRTPQLLTSRRWGLQLLRAVFLLSSTVFNFFAVRYLQLAETMSIMFAAPFVVTALAGPLLAEWAGPRRWAAIIVGFVGVLIVTRPGLGGMHWAAILSVAAMTSYALYALTTRMLAATDSAVGMLVISAAVATLAVTPFAFSEWVTPASPKTWLLLLSTGFLGCIGHFLLIKAHRLAAAPVLAPFLYIEIVWMIGLGYFIFGDVPGMWTLVGAAVVVASGLYILYRERAVKGDVGAAAAE